MTVCKRMRNKIEVMMIKVLNKVTLDLYTDKYCCVLLEETLKIHLMKNNYHKVVKSEERFSVFTTFRKLFKRSN